MKKKMIQKKSETLLCWTAHRKTFIRFKRFLAIFFCTNLRLEEPQPVYFSCMTFRLCAIPPATLLMRKCTTRPWTLRCCGKATAAFVRTKHRDFVAEVWKCGSRGLDLIFPVQYLSNTFNAVRTGTSTSSGIFLFFFGFVQKETSMWHHMIRNLLFVVSWTILLRLTAGALVLLRKSTTLQNVPWLCARIQEEFCAISGWSFTATSAMNIALSGGAPASWLKLRIRLQPPRARDYRQLGIISPI